MSYEIRNTLVLILILALLSGGGYFGLHLRYDDDLTSLAQEIEKRQKEFSKLEGFLADLDYYYGEIKTEETKLVNYPKILLHSEAIHQTYQYLEYLDRMGTFFDFTFILMDIKAKGDIVNASYQLSGEGKFQKLVAFMIRLEKLKPIYRIDYFRMQNKNDPDDEDLLRVDLRLTGVFSNEDRAKAVSVHSFRNQPKYNLHKFDPFNPLVLRKLPPNDRNLPVVEKCTLVAITGNLAYIKDQSNTLKKMKSGDEVYLGYLARIDVNNGTVTFEMDRGGIEDTYVLNLNSTIKGD